LSYGALPRTLKINRNDRGRVCTRFEEHEMARFDPTYPSGAGEDRDLRDRPMHLHWWAIFGGGVIGWGLLFFLSLLGLTIGLAAIEPYSARPASGVDVGSAIWGLLALVLCSIVGAYFVVRIAGERRKREAALHAAVSWGLSMIAGALLAMGAGSTAARTAAENPPRTPARTDANGNVRMTQRDRARLDQAQSTAARTAGGGAAAAFLSLLGALLGAGVGAAHASRSGLGRPGSTAGDRDRALGRTSTTSGELDPEALEQRAGRDGPTILPPTH
jgi:hypothetical protein